jgi:hypothetical protein
MKEIKEKIKNGEYVLEKNGKFFQVKYPKKAPG